LFISMKKIIISEKKSKKCEIILYQGIHIKIVVTFNKIS